MKCVIFGTPLGKPRQTRRDRWQQRPCVVAYRNWADVARAVLGRTTKITLTKPTVLIVKAYFHSGKKHRVGPHTVKPDGDNVAKAVMDALFHNDQMVYRHDVTKLWCDGGQPRIEVEWHP